MGENFPVKQILQSLKTGQTTVDEVPCPQVRPGHVLIRSEASLISAGTERMLVEFGKSNWIEKARSQPDKVRMVLQKLKTDGIGPTIQSVRSKLDQPMPLGYCNVGVVLEVGKGVAGFSVGDRVVSNGPHAEVVCVPENLCAKVPDGVVSDYAAFTVIGAIGLQGLRLAQPTLGEVFVVSGLGLIGLVTVQLLKAHGCRVLGLDFDESRLALARSYGAETVNLGRGEDPLAAAVAFSRGRGVDGVLITAATKSSEPVHQAAKMCRKRGRIVLIGVTGLQLSRADFYEKELSFQVSCSYGPGRYDPKYEEKGQDYPVGFVRWTVQRNFEAVLDMMADHRLNVQTLISHQFPFGEAEKAYELITSRAPSMGILLQYPDEQTKSALQLREPTVQVTPRKAAPAGAVIGYIGAGGFSNQVLIPAFVKAGASLKSIASNGGISGVSTGRKYGFQKATTDAESIIRDPETNTVVIATRHDSHAKYTAMALRSGKNVFVEKPLALNRGELDEVVAAYHEAHQMGHSPRLMVGYNRRFAPQIVKMKQLLTASPEPKTLIMTVNAGIIPPNHWTQDVLVGGGRIIGEGCHFIDLLRFLVGAPVTGVKATMLGDAPGVAVRSDKVTITLTFADGSFGSIHYFGNGNKSFPKERLEVFTAGRVLQLDNFRKMRGYGWPGFGSFNLWSQDKGHRAEVAAFVQSIVEGSESPIPIDELVEVAEVTLNITDALTTC